MNETVVVASSVEHLEEVCAAVPKMYRIIECGSSSKLADLINDNAARLLILDLDSISVDNKFLRKLKTENPDLSILAVSVKTMHPELRESISSYIHACLTKPLDAEELRFWLRSITHDYRNKGPRP